MSLIKFSNKLDILNSTLGVDTKDYIMTKTDMPNTISSNLTTPGKLINKALIEPFNNNEYQSLEETDDTNNKLVFEKEKNGEIFQYEYSIGDEGEDKQFFLDNNEVLKLSYPKSNETYVNDISTNEEYKYDPFSDSLIGYDYPTTEPSIQVLNSRINQLFSIVDGKKNIAFNSKEFNNKNPLSSINQSEANQVRRNLYSFNKNTYDKHI